MIQNNSSNALWDLLQIILTEKQYFLVFCLFYTFHGEFAFILSTNWQGFERYGHYILISYLKLSSESYFPQTRFPLVLSHQSNSEQKRPQIQTPHAELSLKILFLRKARFLLVPFQPNKFWAKWTSESSILRRKNPKSAFSRKLDFSWFFTLPPFCAPSPQLLEEITLRFGSPTLDYPLVNFYTKYW